MTDELKQLLEAHYGQIRDCLNSIKTQICRIDEKIDQHAADILAVKKDHEYLRKDFEEHAREDKRDKDQIWSRIRANHTEIKTMITDMVHDAETDAQLKIKYWVYRGIVATGIAGLGATAAIIYNILTGRG